MQECAGIAEKDRISNESQKKQHQEFNENKRNKERKTGFIKKAMKWISISSDPWPPHLFPTRWKPRLGEETTVIEYLGALFLVTGTVINKVDQSKTEEAIETETDEPSPRRAKWVMDKFEENPDSALCHMDGSLEDPKSCLRRTQVEFRGRAPYDSENRLN